jgi:hypothetical protein
MQPLLQRQARRGSSPRDLADCCEIVFVSLPTLAAFREVAFGAEPLIHGNAMKLLVNTCTVGVSFVPEVEHAMAARGVTVSTGSAMPSACNKALHVVGEIKQLKVADRFLRPASAPEINGNHSAVGRDRRDHLSLAFAAAAQLVQQQDWGAPLPTSSKKQADLASIDVGHRALVSSAGKSVCKRR